MSQIYWVIHRPGHGTMHKLQLKVSEKIWKSCQHCDAVCHIPVIYNYTNCTALLSMQYPQPYLSSTGWDPVTAKNPAQELSSNRMQCTNYWYKSLYSITIMHTYHKCLFYHHPNHHHLLHQQAVTGKHRVWSWNTDEETDGHRTDRHSDSKYRASPDYSAAWLKTTSHTVVRNFAKQHTCTLYGNKQ